MEWKKRVPIYRFTHIVSQNGLASLEGIMLIIEFFENKQLSS